MSIQINSVKTIIEYVNTETGEVFTDERQLGEETKKTKKTSTKASKKPKDNEPVAKIRLTDTKLEFNNAAVELTGFEPDMKIDVKFEKQGRKQTPIMMEDSNNGNRLTKTFTISCRGTRHDNLAVYGDTFEVVPYEGKEGFFKLIGNAPQAEDDIIDVPEEITDPESLDEDDITGADEDNGTEIDFNLDDI